MSRLMLVYVRTSFTEVLLETQTEKEEEVKRSNDVIRYQ
jgi:hypothetical protein